MERWSFFTNHARVLFCLADDPSVRLRDVAAGLGMTERSAHAIVADLAAAGYVVKHKNGRRNRYQIQARMPLPQPTRPGSASGDVLALLMGGSEAEGRTAPSARAYRRDHDLRTAADTRTTESGGVSA